MGLQGARHGDTKHRVARHGITSATVVDHRQVRPVGLVAGILEIDVGTRIDQLVAERDRGNAFGIGHLGGDHHVLACDRLPGGVIDLTDVWCRVG